MKIKKLMALAVAMLCTAGAWAQSVGDVITYNGSEYEVKGANLITNGSFDDGVNGWYAGNWAAANASNYTLPTSGGFDNGAYLQYSAGGVGSVTNIRGKWTVENGKMYLFRCYTSGSAPSSANLQYSALRVYDESKDNYEGASLYQLKWGASDTWTQNDFVFTANCTAVTFRSSWTSNAKLDGFALVEIERYISPEGYNNALTAAKNALENTDYSNVTGSEKTALENAISTYTDAESDKYEEAINALEAATAAFTAAKTNYDAFVAAKTAETPTLKYAAAAKATALNEAKTATATSAEDAATKAAAIATALRAYYESHALAEGVAEAVNMTDRIKNNDASNGNNDWTWTGNKNAPKNNEPWTDASGNSTHTYFDGGSWSANSWTTTMKQSVSIPAGKYLLTAKGRAATNTTLTMAVGEKSVALPNIGSTVGTGVFDRGWGDASLEFETDGSDIEILVTASTATVHEWFSISNFRLVRLELYTEMAKAEDYAALNAAIAAAEAKTLGFDANEYAPYNNVEALNALATAKAIDQTAENGKDEITALTTALGKWTANAAEVDAIFDGQFATTEALSESGKVVLPGWTKIDGIRLLVKDVATDPGLAYTDGKAAVFSWGGTTLTYGAQAGYTLPLNKHELYELTLKVSGWRDGDFPNVVTIGLDGATQTVNAASLGANKINNAEGNPFASLKFYVTPTADNSTLTVYGNHHFTVADLSLKLAVAEEVELNENADYTPDETYANVTLKRNIKDGYNTVVLPFDLTAEQTADVFGTGAEVYTYTETAEGENSTITFAKKDEAAIAANVPVLVKATANAAEKTINGVMTSAAGVQNATGTNFDFVGSYSASTALIAGDYFFNDAKLYKSNGDNTMKGFRAYLKAKTTGSVKLIIEGLETGIEAINGQAEATDGAIYNVAGQRVQKAVKGLYIINGKKVMVK